MNEYIKQYILEKAKVCKIGIWGTGKCAYIAQSVLHEINIDNYVYIDNDISKQGSVFHDKQVVSPLVIDKDWFILISNQFFREISLQLESKEMHELKHYIWAFELDYYDGLIHYQNAPMVPDITFNDLDQIEEMLSKCTSVKKIDWFNEEKFTQFEQSINFSQEYLKGVNKRYRRKIMEYFIVNELLNFDNWNSQDIYIDIGAASSPFAIYLREKLGLKAFALDLEQGIYKDKEYYLQEDATHMHFEDNSVKAMSIQSAFEMFVGTADINFINEAARVLKPGGKVIILPLYMHKKFLSTVSPNFYHKGFADVGALECIRTDCRGGVPLGRFYSVNKLNERVITQAEKSGLSTKVLTLPNEFVEKDGLIYFKFILVLQKMGECDDRG